MKGFVWLEDIDGDMLFINTNYIQCLISGTYSGFEEVDTGTTIVMIDKTYYVQDEMDEIIEKMNK